MYRKLLEQGLNDGVIHLRVGSGEPLRFGTEGREATWVLRDEFTIKRIARNWEMQLGQTYTEGAWHVEDCQLQDLLYILRKNFSGYSIPRVLKPAAVLLQQWNRISNSFSNVSRHYDLDSNLFRRFLDEDMHYSCAYFSHPGMSLEAAQRAKCEHIRRKLLLEPGQRVLDIGCGWGSLALHLAACEDVEVHGITLSRNQLEYARWRAQTLGVKNARFELADYREHRASYDRIVSVGMFEHVGKPFHLQYYRELRRLLKPQGVALIHSIGRSGPPALTNPWIRKYIFPGGSIPSLSEMTCAAEQAGILQTDIEVLRMHYAYTLRAWYERFQQNRKTIGRQLGERFCRMWEFYLAVCEVSFLCSDLVVYQQQLAEQHGVVPITRDYLYHLPEYAWERSSRGSAQEHAAS